MVKTEGWFSLLILTLDDDVDVLGYQEYGGRSAIGIERVRGHKSAGASIPRLYQLSLFDNHEQSGAQAYPREISEKKKRMTGVVVH